jgi:hypothetical protein
MAAGQLVAEVEPELYVCWVQWASLLPIMRFHGVGAREPTAYPEPARSAAIAACKFRKRLQPYLIEIARTAAETGIPMMRPMPLAYRVTAEPVTRTSSTCSARSCWWHHSSRRAGYGSYGSRPERGNRSTARER